jgi:hypothetical protein
MVYFHKSKDLSYKDESLYLVGSRASFLNFDTTVRLISKKGTLEAQISKLFARVTQIGKKLDIGQIKPLTFLKTRCPLVLRPNKVFVSMLIHALDAFFIRFSKHKDYQI